MKFYKEDRLTALEAKEKAQWIAFAPMVFQATRALRDLGILTHVSLSKEKGVTLEEIADAIKVSTYGIRVLLEAGLGIGLLVVQEGRYRLTKTGYFILHDRLTQVNMDFMNDVCYQGAFFLNESIKEEKPVGLQVFGQWKTIYEALSQLPPGVQKSWFGFDHFYSDYAFPDVLPHVFKNKPGRILDIGGNTGKWALQCVAYDPQVSVTLMDLPGQLNMAKEKVKQQGYETRIDFYACNILDEQQPFATGYDVIWMSQFLDCFSENQITSILKRCKAALLEGGSIFILEPFWDRQRFEASAFALQQTSLYFTTMANGNSQMYCSETFLQCIEKAGLRIIDQKDLIGVSHTLIECN